MNPIYITSSKAYTPSLLADGTTTTGTPTSPSVHSSTQQLLSGGSSNVIIKNQGGPPLYHSMYSNFASNSGSWNQNKPGELEHSGQGDQVLLMDMSSYYGDTSGLPESLSMSSSPSRNANMLNNSANSNSISVPFHHPHHTLHHHPHPNFHHLQQQTSYCNDLTVLAGSHETATAVPYLEASSSRYGFTSSPLLANGSSSEGGDQTIVFEAMPDSVSFIPCLVKRIFLTIFFFNSFSSMAALNRPLKLLMVVKGFAAQQKLFSARLFS